MRNHTIKLTSILFALFPSVAGADNCDIQVKYIDRNGDNIIDQEIHQHPCIEDANWELLDNDFDGIYETKIKYGIAPVKSTVNIPVHKGKPANES